MQKKTIRKKYELTTETLLHFGRTLYRVKALRSFGSVQAGALGGWIEKESNLSHEGDCWVYNEAKVFDNAKVYGNACVYGNAKVFDRAWIFDYAIVCYSAQVYGEARVSGSAAVFDRARVYENAKVYGSAQVYGNAWVFDKARVYGSARVYGNAWVYGDEIGFGKEVFRHKIGVFDAILGEAAQRRGLAFFASLPKKEQKALLTLLKQSSLSFPLSAFSGDFPGEPCLEFSHGSIHEEGEKKKKGKPLAVRLLFPASPPGITGWKLIPEAYQNLSLLLDKALGDLRIQARGGKPEPLEQLPEAWRSFPEREDFSQEGWFSYLREILSHDFEAEGFDGEYLKAYLQPKPIVGPRM